MATSVADNIATMDVSLDSRPNGSANNEAELSPIEQEILDEYAKLVGNLDNVRQPLLPAHRFARLAVLCY